MSDSTVSSTQPSGSLNTTTIILPVPTTLTIYTTNRVTFSTITAVQTQTETTYHTPTIALSDLTAFNSALASATTQNSLLQDTRFIILVALLGSVLLLLLVAVGLFLMYLRRRTRSERQKREKAADVEGSELPPSSPTNSPNEGQEAHSSRTQNEELTRSSEQIAATPLSRTFDFEVFGSPSAPPAAVLPDVPKPSSKPPKRPKRPASSPLIRTSDEVVPGQLPKAWDLTSSPRRGVSSRKPESSTAKIPQIRIQPSTPSTSSHTIPEDLSGDRIAFKDKKPKLAARKTRKQPEGTSDRALRVQEAELDFSVGISSDADNQIESFIPPSFGKRRQQENDDEPPPSPTTLFAEQGMRHQRELAVTDETWRGKRRMTKREPTETSGVGRSEEMMFRSDDFDKEEMFSRASSGIFPDMFDIEEKESGRS